MPIKKAGKRIDRSLLNDDITAPNVRLVGAGGEQRGVVSRAEALAEAKAAGLDLVLVAAEAEPPVCKVMDYGKHLFELKKTKAAQRKKQKQIQVKEMKFRPGTEEDRMIVDFEVEEQPTGELSLGAGFSSAESLLLEIGISERNLLGRGQSVRLNISTSERRKQFEIGFTQPYFLGRRLTAGFDIFHIDKKLFLSCF